MTVLLAGVRADLSQGLKNLGFGGWLPTDRIFHEEDRIYSATLKAVRHVHELLGRNSNRRTGTSEVIESEKQSLYYLV